MRLEESDVRSMVRLIGEVAALSGGHAEKKRYLMDGLCKLVEADAWAWGLACQRPGQPQIYVGVLSGGLTEQTYAAFFKALEHPDMITLTSRFFQEFDEKKAHITRFRKQFVDDAVFERSGAHALWREAQIDDLIISQRPLDERCSSALGLYRRFGRKRYTARECRIAHIVLTEVPWLHEQGWPEDRGVDVPTLSRRQRMALYLLARGQSHKQIAGHMNISLHTARDYIKAVYGHFGVHSQSELMKRFFQGDGQDGA